jgi:hypothetical protein
MHVWSRKEDERKRGYKEAFYAALSLLLNTTLHYGVSKRPYRPWYVRLSVSPKVISFEIMFCASLAEREVKLIAAVSVQRQPKKTRRGCQ